MNTKLWIFIPALILSTSAHAQIATDPIETEKQINAQIAITQDLFRQVNQQLSKGAGDLTFKVSDYRASSKLFLKTVDQAESEFERSVQAEVLPELRVYLNQYNSTVLSTQIGESQKSLLLSRIDSQKSVLENRLSLKYQKLMRRLIDRVAGSLVTSSGYVRSIGTGAQLGVDCDFAVMDRYENTNQSVWACLSIEKGKRNRHNRKMGPEIIDVEGEKFALSSNELKSYFGGSQVEIIRAVMSNGSNCYSYCEGVIKAVERVLTHKQRTTTSYYEDYVFANLIKGCNSIACISFRAGDYKNFLEHIRRKVNRDLTYTMAGAGDYPPRFTIRHADDARIDYALTQLVRVDYPEQSPPLPFDTAN